MRKRKMRRVVRKEGKRSSGNQGLVHGPLTLLAVATMPGAVIRSNIVAAWHVSTIRSISLYLDGIERGLHQWAPCMTRDIYPRLRPPALLVHLAESVREVLVDELLNILERRKESV